MILTANARHNGLPPLTSAAALLVGVSVVHAGYFGSPQLATDGCGCLFPCMWLVARIEACLKLDASLNSFLLMPGFGSSNSLAARTVPLGR